MSRRAQFYETYGYRFLEDINFPDCSENQSQNHDYVLILHFLRYLTSLYIRRVFRLSVLNYSHVFFKKKAMGILWNTTVCLSIRPSLAEFNQTNAT